MASYTDPIVVAPSPTPFTADDKVDLEAIEGNVEKWLSTPLTGFVLNSENGEETFLSEQERLSIVRTVKGVSGNQKLIIGGVDNPSVAESLRLAENLVEAGAEMIRVRVPRNHTNVTDYFQQVVTRAPAPVIIIHQMAPGTFLGIPTAIGAPAEVLSDLISMDNVFGYIASADLRFEARVKTRVSGDKKFMMGNASIILPGISFGANSACMMLGNVAPQHCHDILTLATAGKWSEAQAVHNNILETDWQILSRGAAGVKAAMNLLGFSAGGPRVPAPACEPEQVERIRAAMIAAGLLHG
jgi:dihydrodipicolinate synthase/N-acetylneuraminate lyase